MVEELLKLDVTKEVLVLIISSLPIVELRGSLPVAINLFNMPWYWALFLAILGTMLPVPFLLLFLEKLSQLVSKTDKGRRFVIWLFQRTRRRGGLIERYERIGLALFVAIPLPFTGAWTGSLCAFLFGLSFRYSLISIFIGVVIAGVIITSLSLLGWVGALIAGFTLATLAALGLWRL